MIVTDIIPASNSKLKIFIDEEFSFVLYKGELRSLGIKVNEELDEDTYNKIFSEVLPKRAKLRAMHLLERRPYTEKEMRDKLKDNMYSSEIIDSTIEYLKGYRYIDDFLYASQYLTTYTNSKSLKKMKQDLMQKGVKDTVIELAMGELEELGDLADESNLIKEYIRKRKYDVENSTYQEYIKMCNYLYGKGFSMDSIRKNLKYKGEE